MWQKISNNEAGVVLNSLLHSVRVFGWQCQPVREDSCAVQFVSTRQRGNLIFVSLLKDKTRQKKQAKGKSLQLCQPKEIQQTVFMTTGRILRQIYSTMPSNKLSPVENKMSEFNSAWSRSFQLRKAVFEISHWQKVWRHTLNRSSLTNLATPNYAGWWMKIWGELNKP